MTETTELCLEAFPFYTHGRKYTCTRHIWCLERVFMDEGLGIPLNLSDSQCLPTSDAFKPACAVLPPFPGSIALSFFPGNEPGARSTPVRFNWDRFPLLPPLPLQPVGMNHTLTKSSRGDGSMRPDGAPWSPNRELSAQKTPLAQQVKGRGKTSYLLLSTMFPSFKSLCTMFFYNGKNSVRLQHTWRCGLHFGEHANWQITIAVYYRKLTCIIHHINLGVAHIKINIKWHMQSFYFCKMISFPKNKLFNEENILSIGNHS